MKDTRQIVAEALCKMERERSWSNLVFDAQMQKYNLTSRDSAFAGALFYGVLERALTLDACIAAHSSTKLRKLSAPVLTALRIGLYQILYMDSVPDSAAVAESVELVKKLRQPKSAGLVNAVLRSFLRGEKKIPVPTGPVESALSVRYSCPVPLVRLWLDSYGEEMTRRILAQSLGRPPLAVRVNTRRVSPKLLAAQLEAGHVTVREDTQIPACLLLEGAGTVQKLPAYREGLFHVQDKSSQLCALALDARPGMRVLDACSAPGGKAFTIAQQMEDVGELVAMDLHPKRAQMVARRAAEMGLSAIRAGVADMSAPQNGLGLFDRVLCDVPCSGLGVIRRKPEIKYKPLEEYSEIPKIQYKILENSAQYCKEGGLLLYSTCTLNPAENQQIADRFLKDHPEFVPRQLCAPGAAPGILSDGWQKTLLDEIDADGFFLACFQRL